jgi:hypothetical protein
MGVLEDAIREHLELKRQHGASEEEVVRQETEVLGHARQAAPAGEQGEVLPEDQAAAAEEQPAAAEYAEEPLPAEEPFAEEPQYAEEGPATEESFAEQPQYAEEPPAAEGPPEGLYLDDEPASHATAESQPFDQTFEDEPSREDTVMLDDPELPPEPEPEPEPRRDDTVMLEDPLEFDELEPGVAPPMPAQEEAPPEGERSEDEDVLEETPEFLQETPEHDRLWFEQKPPRDFDFD